MTTRGGVPSPKTTAGLEARPTVAVRAAIACRSSDHYAYALEKLTETGPK